MKRKSLAVIAGTLLFFASCKKDDNSNPGNNGSNQLLSQIIQYSLADPTHQDTTFFTYSNGKLVAYRDRDVHIDSISYNANGQLTAFQWGEVENTQNKVVNAIFYNYNGYDVVKYAIHLLEGSVAESDTIPYTLKNNRPAIMVKHTGMEDYDSTTYSYDSGGDLIQQLRKRQSGAYLYSEQLNETYTARYINPYSTVGDQLYWSLLYDSPVMGAQKMLATEIDQVTYSGNLQTTTSSFSVDAANGNYPTSVTLTETDGSKLILKFNYINK